MKSLIKNISLAAILAVPVFFVQAQGLEDVGDTALDLVKLVGQILIALVFVYFIYGLMKYLTGKDQDEAKSAIGWSIAIMFVLFSIWGIINILQDTVGITGTESAGQVELPDFVE